VTPAEHALLVLACAAFYEASCVGFVHYSGRGAAWKTALMSALAGAGQVTGIFETVRDWRMGVFFVLGLGLGAFTGVRLKAPAGEPVPKGGA
jgi:hypothetical protein